MHRLSDIACAAPYYNRSHDVHRDASGGAAAQRFHALRGARSGAGPFPCRDEGRRQPHLRLLRRDRRRHGGPCDRVQAADRVLRGAPRRVPARTPDPPHAAGRAARAGDPRREARRHRVDRGAIREGGVRALRRRCGDALAVHGLRLDPALPEVPGQGRLPAVPHVQSGRRRAAEPAARFRRWPAAAVRARGAARARTMECQRAARAGGRRDLPGGDRACAAGGAERAVADPRRGRARRRRGRDGGGGLAPRRTDRRQFIARDPLCLVRRRLRGRSARR
jgi:hypothetical protein